MMDLQAATKILEDALENYRNAMNESIRRTASARARWWTEAGEAPRDGWYWYTLAAGEEVRICRVVDGAVFLGGMGGGGGHPVNWAVFTGMHGGKWLQPAFAPESMAYLTPENSPGDSPDETPPSPSGPRTPGSRRAR